MYKLGEVLLLISVAIFILSGGGIIVNIIPKNSPIIAPLCVIALILLGAGAILKKKYK
ncbi:hypothetical protein [Desulfitobacterium metallireducens]|uniref:Uncharacterized protein n=1 Tax=Desulfitobacterium metallireducens DSM 15288 TaxID=871968 RepID=W0ECG1_9FIRM|nr:hypothetical protein [Desulfitobacterium metallireducens]AHF08457.1 hypothetical protein DESME_03455 [Desulfitobacterium metallireducens DSM 15288]